jgi:hypothetical protein
MGDAAILVDDKPAQIIENLSTLKTVRVPIKKESNHTIAVVKGDSIVCSKQVLIQQDNLIISLCNNGGF